MRLGSLAGLALLTGGCSMAIQPFGGDLGSGRAPNAFWPPPRATAVIEHASRTEDNSFGEAAARIERAFAGAGHAALRRFPIGTRYDHGFAFTTRLERIDDDGSSDASPARWSDLYPEPATLRWLERASEPRLPGPGRYRAQLVAFTDLPVVAKDRPPAWDQGTLMESLDEPPPLPAQRRASTRYRLVTFAYEYESTHASGMGQRRGNNAQGLAVLP